MGHMLHLPLLTSFLHQFSVECCRFIDILPLGGETLGILWPCYSINAFNVWLGKKKKKMVYLKEALKPVVMILKLSGGPFLWTSVHTYLLPRGINFKTRNLFVPLNARQILNDYIICPKFEQGYSSNIMETHAWV